MCAMLPACQRLLILAALLTEVGSGRNHPQGIVSTAANPCCPTDNGTNLVTARDIAGCQRLLILAALLTGSKSQGFSMISSVNGC